MTDRDPRSAGLTDLDYIEATFREWASDDEAAHPVFECIARLRAEAAARTPPTPRGWGRHLFVNNGRNAKCRDCGERQEVRPSHLEDGEGALDPPAGLREPIERPDEYEYIEPHWVRWRPGDG